MGALSRKFSTSVTPLALSCIVFLWVLIVVSALGVVASTHEVRKLVHTLETQRREASALQIEWGQYLLEQSTWAAYSRVEAIATSKLHMFPATTDHIVMVTGNE
jgi:cell division protein FtsL